MWGWNTHCLLPVCVAVWQINQYFSNVTAWLCQLTPKSLLPKIPSCLTQKLFTLFQRQKYLKGTYRGDSGKDIKFWDLPSNSFMDTESVGQSYCFSSSLAVCIPFSTDHYTCKVLIFTFLSSFAFFWCLYFPPLKPVSERQTKALL